MKRQFGLVTVLAMIATFAFGSAGTVGAAGTQHFGPFASTSLDNGTCGPWATDTDNRDWKVQANKDGTFTAREEFKNGTFVTLDALSPGGCETTDKHHGTTVRPGVTGSFEGYLGGIVTGGTYNPNGCNAIGADCSTTSGFISATFPGGAFSTTSFRFHYAAGSQGLIYHEWTDESNRDPNGPEVFTGDIATA
jgi:hypothetical protein